MWIIRMPSHFSTFYLYRPLCLALLLPWLIFLVRSAVRCRRRRRCVLFEVREANGYTLHIHMHTQQAHTQNLLLQSGNFCFVRPVLVVDTPNKNAIQSVYAFQLNRIGTFIMILLNSHRFIVWRRYFVQIDSFRSENFLLCEIIFTIEIRQWQNSNENECSSN